jgi:hypothetical protein
MYYPGFCQIFETSACTVPPLKLWLLPLDIGLGRLVKCSGWVVAPIFSRNKDYVHACQSCTKAHPSAHQCVYACRMCVRWQARETLASLDRGEVYGHSWS